MDSNIESGLSHAITEIKCILRQARNNAVVQVNSELLTAYWKIGEIIVRYEQDNNLRAAYGEGTLKQMSKMLTRDLGKGFSRSNLQNMRLLYLNYEKCQTLSGKLSWSHYNKPTNFFKRVDAFIYPPNISISIVICLVVLSTL